MVWTKYGNQVERSDVWLATSPGRGWTLRPFATHGHFPRIAISGPNVGTFAVSGASGKATVLYYSASGLQVRQQT